MNGAPPRGVVGLLTAQAFAFGVTLALLLVPANSLFLDAYGSQWLPVTYIATAVVGSAAAALIARAARRTRLIRVATASLGAFATLFAASWAILVAGGEWVSGVLLVMFPIAIQIGFVFIGGQAGRLLDVRQMKELFPRVVSGFAVGFLVGGAVEIPLLALLGSTENLFLATTAAQLSFLGLLLSHRTPLSGGQSRAGRRRAGSGPAAAPEAVHGPPGAAARLPAAVGDGLAGGRLPALRSRRGALHRRRPDALPVDCTRRCSTSSTSSSSPCWPAR